MKKTFKKEFLKPQRGITLIALVITIIVLLILAGVSINVLSGGDGILNKFTNSVDTNKEATAQEQVKLKLAEFQTEYYDEMYFKKSISVNTKMGNWIAQNKTGEIKTEDYTFEITGSSPYTVTIKQNNTLRADIKGTLSEDGELNWASSGGDPISPTPPATTKYTIIYNSNGGSGTMVPGEKTKGANYTIAECSFTAPAGKKFKNWQAEGGAEYNAGATYSTDANLVLNAIWEDNIQLDGSWTGSVNSPKLLPGMKAVYWDGDTEVIKAANELDESTTAKWYDYDSNKWANAVTYETDGTTKKAYWVWIPRYEYSVSGTTVNINFIEGTSTTASSGYEIHPAFRNGNGNYDRGEWKKELTGFWIAKYEMSGSTAANMKSVPGVESWRSITTGDCYTNSKAMDPDNESHLIKNSEWGAVAYLTQSKFGRNGTEVSKNSNSSYYTGGSSGATALTNVDQSTTGNATGVFDMNGGAWEFVAGYWKCSSSDLSSYGSSYASSTGTSNEYATVYSSDTADARKDAAITGWFSARSKFVSANWPFFGRGGCSGVDFTGVFESYDLHGYGDPCESFRVVLAGS